MNEPVERGVLQSTAEFERQVQRLCDSFFVFLRNYYHLGYIHTFIEQRGPGCFLMVFDSIASLHDDQLHQSLQKLPWRSYAAIVADFQLPTFMYGFLKSYDAYELAPVLFVYRVPGRAYYALKLCGREAVSLDPPSFHTNASIVQTMQLFRPIDAVTSQVVLNGKPHARLPMSRPSRSSTSGGGAATTTTTTTTTNGVNDIGNDDPSGIMRVMLSMCYQCQSILQPHVRGSFVRCNTCNITLFCSDACKQACTSHVERQNERLLRRSSSSSSSNSSSSTLTETHCMGFVDELFRQACIAETWIERHTHQPVTFPAQVERLEKRELSETAHNRRRVDVPFRAQDFRTLANQTEFSDDEEEDTRKQTDLDDSFDSLMSQLGQMHVSASTMSTTPAAAARSTSATRPGTANTAHHIGKRRVGRPSAAETRAMIQSAHEAGFQATNYREAKKALEKKNKSDTRRQPPTHQHMEAHKASPAATAGPTMARSMSLAAQPRQGVKRPLNIFASTQ